MVVHWHHEILSAKEQITDTCNNLGGIQGHYAKWKNPVSKGHILYNSTYIAY